MSIPPDPYSLGVRDGRDKRGSISDEHIRERAGWSKAQRAEYWRGFHQGVAQRTPARAPAPWGWVLLSCVVASISPWIEQLRPRWRAVALTAILWPPYIGGLMRAQERRARRLGFATEADARAVRPIFLVPPAPTLVGLTRGLGRASTATNPWPLLLGCVMGFRDRQRWRNHRGPVGEPWPRLLALTLEDELLQRYAWRRAGAPTRPPTRAGR